MKKHCKTFNRENKIHRVKTISDPDPYQNKTDPKLWIERSINRKILVYRFFRLSLISLSFLMSFPVENHTGA